jgi:tRNA-specific adenosine deaminase 1
LNVQSFVVKCQNPKQNPGMQFQGKWHEQCENHHLAQHISQLILKQYNSSPKTGKPQSQKNEWTLLASIVMCEQFDSTYKLTVVCMSTGTKCLGYDLLTNDGSLIHDSHAEVITRRAFMKWLYTQMNQATTSIFTRDRRDQFVLRENITFHFFVNQSPCGDASIFSSNNNNDSSNNKKRKRQEEPTETTEKKMKVLLDDQVSGRTGARSISHNYTPGTDNGIDISQQEQSTGIVRTKPGRGPRTISMSCSDKISKWNTLGIQGSLLSNFIPDPIYMSTITIGSSNYFDQTALERTFKSRMSKLNDYHVPYFMCCDIDFPDARSDERVNACSFSMMYMEPNTLEVVIGHRGHKLGVGKKDLTKSKFYPLISKYKLLEEFNRRTSKQYNYSEAKLLCLEYRKRRDDFLSHDPFSMWVITDADKFYQFSTETVSS